MFSFSLSPSLPCAPVLFTLVVVVVSGVCVPIGFVLFSFRYVNDRNAESLVIFIYTVFARFCHLWKTLLIFFFFSIIFSSALWQSETNLFRSSSPFTSFCRFLSTNFLLNWFSVIILHLWANIQFHFGYMSPGVSNRIRTRLQQNRHFNSYWKCAIYRIWKLLIFRSVMTPHLNGSISVLASPIDRSRPIKICLKMAFEVVACGGHGNIHLNFAVHTIYRRQQQVEYPPERIRSIAKRCVVIEKWYVRAKCVREGINRAHWHFFH